MLKKIGKYYHYRFMVRGRLYRGSTELGNLKTATTVANKIRDEIVMGNVGIVNRGPAPTLKEFLEGSFLPYVRRRHKAKAKTLSYYEHGSKQLLRSKIAHSRLNEIADSDVSGYISEHEDFAAAGINQGLRTLRRALRYAYDEKVLDRKPSIHLAANEHQRDTVITAEDEAKYLAACKEPWRTMATIIVELGLRPGEVFKLRCEDVLLDESVLQVTSGKSKAAKRELPITDAVYLAIRKWQKERGVTAGWLFPSPIRPGKHYSEKMACDWHKAAKAGSGITTFVPYCLRHTSLTRLAKHCRNPFAVAKTAGHSSIVTTQRYVHPEEAEIREAFEEKSGLKIGHARRKDQLKVVSGDSEDDA